MGSRLFDLTGKTALITGGTRGIGQAVAIGFAESGADIVLVQRDSSNTATKDGVEKAGRKCFSYPCELTDKDQVAKLVSTITADHKIDILVNMAGILSRHPAVDYPYEVYEEIMQINLSATFVICQDMGRYWINNKMKGRIINTASLTTFFGSVKLVGYAMSKSAVGTLTKSLSNEWAVHGINVNAIAPGYVATDMNLDTRGGDPAYLKQLTDRIPAGRWGNTEDYKGAAIFLASEASAYVTGHILVVDGGFTAR